MFIRLGPSRSARLFPALLCLLIVPSSALARTKTDVVVMKNGDRITCEIKSLEHGQLVIKPSYANATLAIGGLSRVAALFALWAGVLYDAEAMNTAWERVNDWTPEERQYLESEVARHGLRTPFRGGTAQDVCRWIVELSRQGLQCHADSNGILYCETRFLAPLEEALDAGRTYADNLVGRFVNEWRGDIDHALHDLCDETLTRPAKT
jgi:hypothetical protein